MYSVYAMLGLMFLTWAIAIWATYHEPVDRASSTHDQIEMKKAA